MKEFDYKLTVLTTSILQILREIRNGTITNEPFVEYPEPETEE